MCCVQMEVAGSGSATATPDGVRQPTPHSRTSSNELRCQQRWPTLSALVQQSTAGSVRLTGSARVATWERRERERERDTVHVLGSAKRDAVSGLEMGNGIGSGEPPAG